MSLHAACAAFSHTRDAASLDALLRRQRRRCFLYENQSDSQSAYCSPCQVSALPSGRRLQLHNRFLCCRGQGEGPRREGWRGGGRGAAGVCCPHEAHSDEAHCLPFILSLVSLSKHQGLAARGPSEVQPLTEMRESSCCRGRRDLVFDDHCGSVTSAVFSSRMPENGPVY